MPLDVERLSTGSTTADIRQAINNSIQQCIKEGKDPKECAGMVYSMAREATGKEIGREA